MCGVYFFRYFIEPKLKLPEDIINDTATILMDKQILGFN